MALPYKNYCVLILFCFINFTHPMDKCSQLLKKTDLYWLCTETNINDNLEKKRELVKKKVEFYLTQLNKKIIKTPINNTLVNKYQFNSYDLRVGNFIYLYDNISEEEQTWLTKLAFEKNLYHIKLLISAKIEYES